MSASPFERFAASLDNLRLVEQECEGAVAAAKRLCVNNMKTAQDDDVSWERFAALLGVKSRQGVQQWLKRAAEACGVEL